MIAGDSLPTDYLEDEFLSWLNFADAGMLELGNLYLMDYALPRLPSEPP
jgi:hypothetical protein